MKPHQTPLIVQEALRQASKQSSDISKIFAVHNQQRFGSCNEQSLPRPSLQPLNERALASIFNKKQ